MIDFLKADQNVHDEKDTNWEKVRNFKLLFFLQNKDYAYVFGWCVGKEDAEKFEGKNRTPP